MAQAYVQAVMTVESVSEASDGMFEVEKVVGMAKKKGEMRYRVRWKGYSSEFDTWENESTLADCSSFIDVYKEEKRHKEKLAKQRRQEQVAEGAIPETVRKKPSFTYAETTLKDTFWKDLEEGRINVFATDLYSRVKSVGRKDGKEDDLDKSHVTSVESDTVEQNEDQKVKKKRRSKSDKSKDESKGSSKKKKKSKPSTITDANSITTCPNIELGDHSISESDMSLDTNENIQSVVKSDAKKVTKKRPKLETCSWSSQDSGITNPSPTSSEFSYVESPLTEDVTIKSSNTMKQCTVDSTSVKFSKIDGQRKKNDTEMSREYKDESNNKQDIQQSASSIVSSLEPTLGSTMLPLHADMDLRYRNEASLDGELDDVKTPENVASPESMNGEPSDLSPGDFKSAVLQGNFDKVKRALETQYSGKLNTVDPTGMVLLMVAAQKGYDDIVDLLIFHGSSVNAQQKNGTTALMLTCEQGHLSTAMYLVEVGASINLQQTSGETALMKAVRRGRTDIVSFLLYKGANYQARTLNGNSALTFAKHLATRDVEELISQHRDRVTTEFNKQVLSALKGTAQLIGAIFPIHCFPLCEGPTFVVDFHYELSSDKPGIGYLLFVAHARVSEAEVTCRFYGPCAIKSAELNGVPQYPVPQNCGFVLSCCPLKDGKNTVTIDTVVAPTSKTKLLVCAYKAELEN